MPAFVDLKVDPKIRLVSWFVCLPFQDDDEDVEGGESDEVDDEEDDDEGLCSLCLCSHLLKHTVKKPRSQVQLK